MVDLYLEQYQMVRFTRDVTGSFYNIVNHLFTGATDEFYKFIDHSNIKIKFTRYKKMFVRQKNI